MQFNSNPIFRPAVIKQRNDLLAETNTLLRAEPPTTWWLSLIIILSLVIIFSLIPWAKHLVVRGVIVPEHGLLELKFPENREIVMIKAKLGQVVQRGEIIAKFKNIVSHNREGNLEKEAALKLIQEQAVLKDRQEQLALNHTQIISLLAQKEEIKLAAIKKQENFLAINEQILKILAKEQAAYKKLLQQGLIARNQFAEINKKFLEKTAEIMQIKSQLDELNFQLTQLKLEKEELINNWELVCIEMQGKLHELDLSLLKHDEMGEEVIRAPLDGIITFIQGHAGDLSNNKFINMMQLNDKLVAKLAVPSKFMPFIKNGQEIFLQLDAYPYIKFGLYQGKIENLPLSAQDDFYDITVKLPQNYLQVRDKKYPLLVGMNLSANFIQQKFSCLKIIWSYLTKAAV